jgi:hypothetical protein
MKISVSVVVPVFNSESSLDELVSRVDLALRSKNVEIDLILVDDGSSDKSWKKIVRPTMVSQPFACQGILDNITPSLLGWSARRVIGS